MKYISLSIICLSMFFKPVVASDTTFVTMKFYKIPVLPPAIGKTKQHGVAGAVTGICGKHLVVAGGANFEDNVPWRGGTKSYHDEIYLLSHDKKGDYIWSQTALVLPEPVAYPACATVSGGMLSIGGENKSGPVNKVLLLRFRQNKLQFKPLPNLPEAISSAGAAVIGDKVYVAGGLTEKGESDHFFMIDLSVRKPHWKSLSALPYTLSHGVVVAQSDGNETCVYVIGGRYRAGEVSTFLNTVLKYSPSRDTWEKVGEINSGKGEPFGLSAGTGVAYAEKYIVLFGGDKGIIFNQTERINNTLASLPAGPEKEELFLKKDKLLSEHEGFFRDVLLFNTVTLKFETAGALPVTAPVTTTAVWWNHKVYIPSGEIKPGIRTDEVLVVELNGDK